jgi:hypothetical protein
MSRDERAKTRLTSVGISVTAPTTPGTLTNSGLTFGCNRTHEHGRARRELAVAVANHHCNGLKPYLNSRLYQAFFPKIIHPIPRYRHNQKRQRQAMNSFCNSGIPCLLRETARAPLQKFSDEIRCRFLDKSAAWEQGDW